MYFHTGKVSCSYWKAHLSIIAKSAEYVSSRCGCKVTGRHVCLLKQSLI